MFEDRFTIDSPNGARLNAYRRKAAGTPRGLFLVQHGLAEHAGRYGGFAQDLSASGFTVLAHDHRGHGATLAPGAPPGRFARRDGAEAVIEDCRAVHDFATAKHPGLPVIVFGHSMGGLIAMNYAERFGADLAGLCVWNANFNAGLEERLGRLALKAEKALKGADVPSRLLARATFEAWGKTIAPRRTPFDWLSHDARAVDAYIADPLCGFSPSVSMMEDVLRLVFEGGRRERLRALPKSLPVHLLGGRGDPATDHAGAVEAFAMRLKAAGLAFVRCQIVEGARHETLNEMPEYRDQAMHSLMHWLNDIIPQSGENAQARAAR